jgi:uncharacterized protein (DUF342 family)
MTSDNVPRRGYKEDSAENFSAYRKLILRELERLDENFNKQADLVNTIRLEIVRLAESIEANSKDLNQARGDAKTIETEVSKLATLEEKIKSTEARLKKIEEKLEKISSETKISGAATGAGSGAIAAAVAEVLRLVLG